MVFADLSPGLAALTVGCDSGNLGALSRVQLLLLDRVEAGTPPSPLSLGEELPAGQDWSELRLQNLEPAGKPGLRKHAPVAPVAPVGGELFCPLPEFCFVLSLTFLVQPRIFSPLFSASC